MKVFKKIQTADDLVAAILEFVPDIDQSGDELMSMEGYDSAKMTHFINRVFEDYKGLWDHGKIQEWMQLVKNQEKLSKIQECLALLIVFLRYNDVDENTVMFSRLLELQMTFSVKNAAYVALEVPTGNMGKDSEDDVSTFIGSDENPNEDDIADLKDVGGDFEYPENSKNSVLTEGALEGRNKEYDRTHADIEDEIAALTSSVEDPLDDIPGFDEENGIVTMLKNIYSVVDNTLTELNENPKRNAALITKMENYREEVSEIKNSILNPKEQEVGNISIERVEAATKNLEQFSTDNDAPKGFAKFFKKLWALIHPHKNTRKKAVGNISQAITTQLDRKRKVDADDQPVGEPTPKRLDNNQGPDKSKP